MAIRCEGRRQNLKSGRELEELICCLKSNVKQCQNARVNHVSISRQAVWINGMDQHLTWINTMDNGISNVDQSLSEADKLAGKLAGKLADKLTEVSTKV